MTRAGTVSFNVESKVVEDILGEFEARGRIAYTADYAVYVEKDTAWVGTQPPFDPLRRWVGRKWPDLDQGLKDAGLSDGITPNSDKHKDSVAWIVVKAISANGIEGVFFAGRALEHGINKAEAVARQYEGSDDPDAAKRIITDITDLMFGKSQDIIAAEASDTGTLLQSGQVTIESGEDSVRTVDQGDRTGDTLE